MANKIALCSAVLFGTAAGHGSMELPVSRSAGPGASMWFSQGCTIGCACNEDNNVSHIWAPLCDDGAAPAINDPSERTFQDGPGDIPPPTFMDMPDDWSAYHPWRAPGSATPLDPCGLAGGSTQNNDAAGGFGNTTVAGEQGFPGSQLPPNAAASPLWWAAGEVVDVEWSIAANHGGGYQYRLCSADEPLTEACFRKTPLGFVGATSTLRWRDGRSVVIDATRVAHGTAPAGSVWTKNPIPACDNYQAGFMGVGCNEPAFAPPPGCDETCWGYQPCYAYEFPDDPTCANTTIKTTEIPNIQDRVRVPADLPPGRYVVGFRWDSEHTPQVWQNCGDVVVLAAPPSSS